MHQQDRYPRFELNPEKLLELPKVDPDWDAWTYPDEIPDLVEQAQRSGVVNYHPDWELGIDIIPDDDGGGIRWILRSRDVEVQLHLCSRLIDRVWLGDQACGIHAQRAILADGVDEANALLQEFGYMCNTDTGPKPPFPMWVAGVGATTIFATGVVIGMFIAQLFLAWVLH